MAKKYYHEEERMRFSGIIVQKDNIQQEKRTGEKRRKKIYISEKKRAILKASTTLYLGVVGIERWGEGRRKGEVGCKQVFCDSYANDYSKLAATLL